MTDTKGDEVVSALQKAAAKEKLVAVIGTGMSIALAPRNPTLSWKGLIRDGFEYGVRKGRIQPSQSDGSLGKTIELKRHR